MVIFWLFFLTKANTRCIKNSCPCLFSRHRLIQKKRNDQAVYILILMFPVITKTGLLSSIQISIS